MLIKPVLERIVKSIAELRVEPVVLIMMVVVLSRNMVTQQLMQDKLCQFKYGHDAGYCLSINSEASSAGKNSILADTATLLSLMASIAALPQVVVIIYTGLWCERFVSGRRYVLFITLAGVLLDSLLMLMNSIFYQWDYRIMLISGMASALIGNGVTMVCCSYIAATTVQGERTTRYLIFEVFNQLGIVLGYFVAGHVTTIKSLIFPATGLRNYSDVFLIGTILSTGGIVWTYFRVTNNAYLHNEDEEQSTSPIPSTECESISLTQRICAVTKLPDCKDMWQTLTRERAGSSGVLRMLAVHVTIMLPYTGIVAVIFPLTERLYFWNMQVFSLMMGLSNLVRPFSIALFVIIAVKPFKLSELQVTMIGIVCITLGLISIGSITTPVGFFMDTVLASLTATAISGLRSYLSVLLDAKEVTQVFCLMQITEAIIPSLGSALLSQLFTASIDSYPTLVFHGCALLLIISLAVVAHIDVTNPKS